MRQQECHHECTWSGVIPFSISCICFKVGQVRFCSWWSQLDKSICPTCINFQVETGYTCRIDPCFILINQNISQTSIAWNMLPTFSDSAWSNHTSLVWTLWHVAVVISNYFCLIIAIIVQSSWWNKTGITIPMSKLTREGCMFWDFLGIISPESTATNHVTTNPHCFLNPTTVTTDVTRSSTPCVLPAEESAPRFSSLPAPF